jgi:eukaryotic-like serine/threonine-protein kinase
MKVGEVMDERYELVRQIGVGGMGAVWEARDLAADRRVAIKALHEHLVDQHELVARFLREGQAAMETRYSAHIIEVLAVVNPPERAPYLVMEYLEGEELREVLEREGRLEPRRAVELVIQTCEAVAEVHRQGLIHRDIKPENLFVTKLPDGTEWIKLLDFGVVKFSAAATAERLTGFGRTVGTPQYMAPEQSTEPDTIDHRVDIYAAGVVLYELLAGDVPFDCDDERKLLAMHSLAKPRPLHESCPELDRRLEQVVLRAMAANRRKRFQTMFDLARALEPFRATGRSSSRSDVAVRELRTVQEETPEAVAELLDEVRRERRGWRGRRLVWAIVIVAAAAASLACALLVALTWRSCRREPEAGPAEPVDLSAAPILARGPDARTPPVEAGPVDADVDAIGDEPAAEETWMERYGEKLDRVALDAGLRALSPAVGFCLKRSRPPGTRVLVHFWITSDGQISYRTARPEPSAAEERCLRQAARATRIEPTGVPAFVATRAYTVPD